MAVVVWLVVLKPPRLLVGVPRLSVLGLFGFKLLLGVPVVVEPTVSVELCGLGGFCRYEPQNQT